MSRENRGKVDIIADLLETASSPLNKTQLMYKCNLSNDQIRRYLGDMLGSRLVQQIYDEDFRTPLYRTTERGRRYMELYDKLRALVDDSEKIVSYNKSA